MNRSASVLLPILLLGLVVATTVQGQLSGPPTLKWKHAGCVTGGGTWCDHGYYSSPYIGDFDKNGKVDVIFGAYSIYNINGTNGQTIWKFKTGQDIDSGGSGSGRTWSDIIVADLNGDGKNELVTGHEQSKVCVYTSNRQFAPNWPKTVGTGEIRSISVADIDGDGKKEIIVGCTGSIPNTFIYNYNGSLWIGWPQKKSTTRGYSAGIYNHNVAAFDMVPGNGALEIVAPSDVNYIMVYNKGGYPTAANGQVYKFNNGTGKTWGEVPIFAKISNEIQGWGVCEPGAGTTRPNLAGSRPVFSDMNRDGIPELLIIGNEYDCGISDSDYLYYGPYIFNRDRTRFAPVPTFNWTTTPMNTGKPLYPVGSYDIIQDVQPNVVSADIDGNGIREILYPSYSGQMKVYWLDKSIRHNWTKLNLQGEYPTEPLIVDFKNDGKAEVIFATYPKQVAGKTGSLYICDYAGNVKYKVALPPAPPEFSGGYNGCLSAPTIGNIDGDADLEIVLSTWSTGLIAYDLPGSAGARIIWGTGSLNYDRNPDEWTYSKGRCNTCLNACYTTNNCGTNAACKTACSTQCKTQRACY